MLLAWATMLLYWYTGNPLWAAAASFQALINIFNLLPTSMLDGGQIMRAIAFSINKWLGAGFMVAGWILGAIIMLKFKIVLFALILLVGGIEIFVELRYRIKMLDPNVKKWQIPDSVLEKKYPQSMNLWQIVLTVVGYVATVGALVAIILLTKGLPGADVAANFLE